MSYGPTRSISRSASHCRETRKQLVRGPYCILVVRTLRCTQPIGPLCRDQAHRSGEHSQAEPPTTLLLHVMPRDAACAGLASPASRKIHTPLSAEGHRENVRSLRSRLSATAKGDSGESLSFLQRGRHGDPEGSSASPSGTGQEPGAVWNCVPLIFPLRSSIPTLHRGPIRQNRDIPQGRTSRGIHTNTAEHQAAAVQHQEPQRPPDGASCSR